MVTVGLETQSQKTPVPSGAKLQKQKVTGRIYDQQGEPLVGASVRIKGTNIGSVADINGVYEIEAEPNAVLQFSYIGMEAQEITYKGGNKLDVSLKADNKTELEAVVVTGIFQKPKESFTGAVSTITSEQLKMYKGQNMLQTLRNVDASINLAVDNISGSNPNNLPNINIRGTSSLPMSVKEFNEGVKGEVNTPLIIMDGFEISLTKLMDYNDNDIESINILKDASATALYGSRGANGVIVIVSKRPVFRSAESDRYDRTQPRNARSYFIRSAACRRQTRAGTPDGTLCIGRLSYDNDRATGNLQRTFTKSPFRCRH